MITVNTYLITERAVQKGVAEGVDRVLQNPKALEKPEQIVESLAEAVMDELSAVLDFGIQTVRFTGEMKKELLAMYAQQETTAEGAQ